VPPIGATWREVAAFRAAGVVTGTLAEWALGPDRTPSSSTRPRCGRLPSFRKEAHLLQNACRR